MKITVISLVLYSLLASQPGFATNGYFPHGIGALNKAMAGAGMANPQDAISVVNNPAVAVLLDNRLDVGVSVYQPRRNYESLFDGSHGQDGTFTINEADIDSDKDIFFAPETAGTRQLQNGSALAWAFYVQNGMTTSYKGASATFDPDGEGPLGIETRPGTYGDGTAGMELSQAFVDITWARMWGENTSFGISAVLAAQSLEVEGTGGLGKYTKAFSASGGSVLPESLSGNGRDLNYGAGIKVGLHRLLGEHFSLGLMYQSQINVGTAAKYSDLFANGGDIDIPSWARIGLTWRPNDALSVSIDGQYIFYAGVDGLGNSFFNVYDCPGAGRGGTDLESCLGGSNGPGFGWGGVPILNFGASWDVSEKWTLLGGLSIGNQPVQFNENIFSLMMLNLTETHYTAGVSREFANGHRLSVAFMYSEEESLEWVNQLDPNQVIRQTNDEFDLQLSYSWTY